MKKFILTSLVLSSMFYNVACTNEEIATGVIAVGIGIGLSGINSSSSSDNHYDHGGYDRGGYDHRGDHGGQNHGGDRGGRRDCGRDRCFDAQSSYVASLDTNLMREFEADLSANSFAEKNHISNEAGAKIQKAFMNVNQSGLTSFQEIGLDEQALKSIMSRSVPADASIKAMSEKLNLSEVQSKTLLQNLVSEFDQQASNVNSDYWKSCQAKGQWKTPQNAHCSANEWSGCSPETGATLCY